MLLRAAPKSGGPEWGSSYGRWDTRRSTNGKRLLTGANGQKREVGETAW